MALPPQYSEGFGGGYPGTAHAGHIQVHTREDSSNSLEEMFRVVTDPSCSLSSAKPFKDRKLPRSFFEPGPQPALPPQMSPPVGECHFRSASGVAAPCNSARTSSTPGKSQQLLLRVCGDHAQLVAATSPAAVVAMETGQDIAAISPQAGGSAALVTHARAHSSPAKISNMAAAAAVAAAQRQFGGCQSQGQGQGQGHDQGQLAGQQVFYHHQHQNSIIESTMEETYEDPVAGQVTTGGSLGCPEFEICPLPAGWEMAYNEESKIYFVDHNSKTTSWYDPRIPRQMQSGWGQTASDVCRLHLDYLSRCNAQRKLSSLSAQKEQLRRQLEVATRNEHMMRQEMFLMQGCLVTAAQHQSPPHHNGCGKLGDPTLLCVDHQRQESSDSGLAPEPVITPPLLDISDDAGDTSVDGLLSSLKDTDLLLTDFDMQPFRQDFQGSI